MDTKKHQENIEKGKIAENLFSQYLDNQKIPFYYIDQDKATYSEELNTKNIRRPDYIVHTKIGLFHIDVKYRSKKPFRGNSENRFYLNTYEIKTLFNLQNELRSSVWLSFTDDLNTPIFYYAPISEIYEFYKNICQIYEEKYPEEYKKISEIFWIYIPEQFLYDRFSFEKGFYKEPELRFFEKEAECHREEASKIHDPNKIKWANINSYKKSKLFVK
jgi:hypothetical protein